jgi:hypothetical protein
MKVTVGGLYAWIQKGLTLLGPFPSGAFGMTEEEALWLLLNASASHALAAHQWQDIPTKSSAINTLEPIHQQAKALLEALAALEQGSWGGPLAEAAAAARKPLIDVKNRLHAKLAGIASDGDMALQARLHGPRDVSPEVSLYARSELLLALAGKEPGCLRGINSPIHRLFVVLQALSDGGPIKGYGSQGAIVYKTRKQEVPDFAAQIRSEAEALLMDVRESLAKGIAPGELWSPGSDPARADLVKRLLYGHPSYASGERTVSWAVTQPRAATSHR